MLTFAHWRVKQPIYSSIKPTLICISVLQTICISVLQTICITMKFYAVYWTYMFNVYCWSNNSLQTLQVMSRWAIWMWSLHTGPRPIYIITSGSVELFVVWSYCSLNYTFSNSESSNIYILIPWARFHYDVLFFKFWSWTQIFEIGRFELTQLFSIYT